MAFQPGDTIGDYQVIGLLGHGGMGRVYRVRNLLTDREEAMKVVLPDLEEHPELADRFLNEIKLHAKLEHPHIAALYGARRVDDRLVAMLELVDGMSLEMRMKQGAVEPWAALRYIDQTLDALAYAHARGVIHRDIKPANILLTRNDSVKLTDFGIARVLGDQRVTGAGIALGSLPYMSPEQVRAGAVDGRSDLYSLGVTFYEMVTGRRPIQGDSDFAIMNAQLTQVPDPPSAVAPGISAALSDAIMKSLAKHPAERFQGAAEFREVLARCHPAAFETTLLHLPASATIPAADVERITRQLSQHLGPIAKRLTAEAAQHSTSTADLAARLAEQIPDPKERAAFLKSVGGDAKGTPPEGAAAPRVWDQALLDRLTKGLAPHLGPIAKTLVTRAAKSAKGEGELVEALAREIPDEKGRKAFLAAARG